MAVALCGRGDARLSATDLDLAVGACEVGWDAAQSNACYAAEKACKQKSQTVTVHFKLEAGVGWKIVEAKAEGGIDFDIEVPWGCEGTDRHQPECDNKIQTGHGQRGGSLTWLDTKNCPQITAKKCKEEAILKFPIPIPAQHSGQLTGTYNLEIPGMKKCIIDTNDAGQVFICPGGSSGTNYTVPGGQCS